MTVRQSVCVLVAVCIATSIRIAATHAVFSPTFDEPVHVDAGFEYLTEHRYTKNLEHPPFSRIFFAWPLRHAKPVLKGGYERVAEIYASAGGYMRGVVLSRRGNLVFVILTIAGVFMWALQLGGPAMAAMAAALFACLPPVLAHGGLATTDMAGTAGFALGMAALDRWLVRPNWPRTAVLGLAVGFGLVCKLSFLLFFGVSAILLMIARRRFPFWKGLAANVLAMTVVWSVYLFDHHRLVKVDPNLVNGAREFYGWPGAFVAKHVNLPAPRFFMGILALQVHNRGGHGAYLLGQLREDGWWYYFPVAVAVKTPLPFLALAAIGAWYSFRRPREWAVAAVAAGVLGCVMTSHINIGVRHALPIYVPLALLAGTATLSLMASRRGAIVAAVLCGWLLVGSMLAHPDYLPWMNALAGEHPEHVLLDSNLDWGQDVARLSLECRRLGIRSLGTDLFGTVDYRRIGLPPTHEIDRFNAWPGWYALSEAQIVPAQTADPMEYRWLTDSGHFRRIGASIRLYHIE